MLWTATPLVDLRGSGRRFDKAAHRLFRPSHQVEETTFLLFSGGALSLPLRPSESLGVLDPFRLHGVIQVARGFHPNKPQRAVVGPPHTVCFLLWAVPTWTVQAAYPGWDLFLVGSGKSLSERAARPKKILEPRYALRLFSRYFLAHKTYPLQNIQGKNGCIVHSASGLPRHSAAGVKSVASLRKHGNK